MDYSFTFWPNLCECTAGCKVQIVPEDVTMATPVFLSFGLLTPEEQFALKIGF